MVQSNAQVLQETIFKTINKAMDSKLLLIFPSLLDDWNSSNVVNLLLHVKLTQKILVLFLGGKN